MDSLAGKQMKDVAHQGTVETAGFGAALREVEEINKFYTAGLGAYDLDDIGFAGEDAEGFSKNIPGIKIFKQGLSAIFLNPDQGGLPFGQDTDFAAVLAVGADHLVGMVDLFVCMEAPHHFCIFIFCDSLKKSAVHHFRFSSKKD